MNNNTTLFAGIAWDITDVDNFKYFVIGKDGAYMGDVISGSATDRDTWVSAGVHSSGTLYTVKATIASTGVVTGYVDGTERCEYDFSYTPSTADFGLTAIYTGGLTGRSCGFDDLSVGSSTSAVYISYIYTFGFI